MEIRAMTAADLDGVKDIDATGESSQYLHIERSGEGIALVAEHDGRPVAAALGMPAVNIGIFRLIDLRVDFEFRRQGLASAMMFQMIQEARRRGLRAVMVESAADDFPMLQLLIKLGFEPSGLDTHYRSNHDLVKESVVLFFYLTLK